MTLQEFTEDVQLMLRNCDQYWNDEVDSELQGIGNDYLVTMYSMKDVLDQRTDAGASAEFKCRGPHITITNKMKAAIIPERRKGKKTNESHKSTPVPHTTGPIGGKAPLTAMRPAQKPPVSFTDEG